MNSEELRGLADWLAADDYDAQDRYLAADYLRACADALDAGFVRGAVLDHDGVALIRNGTEIRRCVERGSKLLYPVAMPAPAIPQGWKLVPVEPTPGMSEAGAYSTGDNVDGRPVWKATIDEQAAHIYRAMLAAAPTPPVAAENTSAGSVAETAEREHIALRLPEPMTREETLTIARQVFSNFGHRRSMMLVEEALACAIEAETLRRVKEVNK